MQMKSTFGPLRTATHRKIVSREITIFSIHELRNFYNVCIHPVCNLRHTPVSIVFLARVIEAPFVLRVCKTSNLTTRASRFRIAQV